MNRRLSNGLFALALALLGPSCSDSSRKTHFDGGLDFAAPPDLYVCQNLECDVEQCAGEIPTSISGTVYDPAGTTPLYGVSVYIPNAMLDDITTDGVDINAQCTSCAAPLSGKPLVIGVTDSHGHFQLNNVPSGTNIPVVFQTGKFRRAITVPLISSCQDNPIGVKDSTGAETLTRLPRNQKEGHLPLIAITTGGCEGLECVVRAYGFDDSEFTNGTGTGRIHLYTGMSGGGATGSTDAYAFWGSNALYKYDMVLNSCECAPYPRDSAGPGYTNMQTYLDHGGRLFTSDFMYNFFTDPQAPAVFKNVATWDPDQSAPVDDAPYFVDTSFPKGMALNEWLQFVFMSNSPPPNGQINLNSLFYNVAAVHPGTTRWIYSSSNGTVVPSTATNYTAKYLSFNTPFSADPDAGSVTQCGRAVFADIHVSNGLHASVFPSGCQGVTKDQQVTAFEFLFFDIGSCVQDDSQPLMPPPIQ